MGSHSWESLQKVQLKERKTNRPPWYAPNFTFLHFMILMSFLMNLIRDWNVPHPYRNNLLSFNFSNERTTHLLSLLIVIIFFSFLFSMPCNFFPWHPLRNFHIAHGLCPCLLPRSPFWVFNLAGSFCLNYCLGHPFGFST